MVRQLKMSANEAADEQKPEVYPRGYVENFLRVENEVGGHVQQPSLGDGDELPDPGSETSRVPALNVDESWSSEPAHKTLARGEAGDPSRRGFFDVVGRGGRPGDQVAVVHDVFLIRLQLDLVNSPEAVQDERPFPADFQNEGDARPEQLRGYSQDRVEARSGIYRG